MTGGRFQSARCLVRWTWPGADDGVSVNRLEDDKLIECGLTEEADVRCEYELLTRFKSCPS